MENTTWSSLGYLNYTQAHRRYYDGILETFSDFQLCLVDVASGTPVALANCVPAAFSQDLDALPAEGWDWLVETGATGRSSHKNLLGALAISVPPVHRGKGYATRMLREMRELSRQRGFEAMIAPVRPTSKCNYPEVPMAEYIGWTDAEGRLFDPWLRSHLSQGGEIVGPCERSMVVNEHVAFWETWAGRRFQESGDYFLEGGLAPLSIDLERQMGLYEEPNVWVKYAS
jgi:GNAT superfamily N-acetyltransferase